MKAFNKELKAMCQARKMTLSDLAKKAGVSSNYFNMAGGEKGISYQQLAKIIDILDADSDEACKLRHIANFSTPRKILLINDDFINAVSFELILNDSDWNEDRNICKAVLKFAGVKAKIVKN